jgi:hypothetical protein
MDSAGVDEKMNSRKRYTGTGNKKRPVPHSWKLNSVPPAVLLVLTEMELI